MYAMLAKSKCGTTINEERGDSFFLKCGKGDSGIII
jgi:hypothetical protein